MITETIDIDIDKICGTEAGLVSSIIYHAPNQTILPKTLYQAACKGNALTHVNCSSDEIIGSSIAFSKRQALLATLGEFSERYAAGIVDRSKLIQGSYEDLLAKGLNAMNPKELIFFNEELFNDPRTPFKRMETTTPLNWVESFDYFTSQPKWIPAFGVYQSLIDPQFTPSTSTGMAAGKDLKHAFGSGLMECVERDAFTHFWYLQNEIEFVTYSPDFIKATYADDWEIQELFSTTEMKICVFDLTPYAKMETIFAMGYFLYKGKMLYTCGCSSRLEKRDAIVKAMLELYQGVEYAIILEDGPLLDPSAKDHPDQVRGFDQHFSYYNQFPEKRAESIIFRTSVRKEKTDVLYTSDHLIKSIDRDEIKKYINEVYYCELTTPDIAEVGYKIIRVVTPELRLLSGAHQFPYFGYPLFEDKELVKTIPHCFP